MKLVTLCLIYIKTTSQGKHCLSYSGISTELSQNHRALLSNESIIGHVLDFV